uniref:RRM domain-containing protein n=1 Tax=Steinernema glaseri TaxID=37863 RepID=A0A1I7ZM47_9BILA
MTLLAQEYANLERELASLRDQINRQNTTIHSLTSLLHKSPAPQQQFQTVEKNDDWRRFLLFTNNNSSKEAKKGKPKIVTVEAINSFLLNACQLLPSAVKDVKKKTNSKNSVELDSEENVLRVLKLLESLRDAEGNLPWSTRIVRDWPPEQKAIRDKAFQEVGVKGAGHYVDEIDLKVKPCRTPASLSNPNQINQQKQTPVVTTPLNFRTSIVFHFGNIVFHFGKSSTINPGNVETKFAQLLRNCGGAIQNIANKKSCPVSRLVVNFVDEESASTVLKTFQEKKIRDELSPEFRKCRISFNLPKHLQSRRNDLYKEVNNKKVSFGIRNLYVDEYDLTIKERPAGVSLSPATSTYTLNEPSVMYSEEGEEEFKKRPFKIFFSDPKYARMSYFQLMEELFGLDASDIQLEGKVQGGLSLSLNPACQKSLEELLEGLPSGVYFRW